VDELIERLADLEHEQWAHWTRYMLTTLRPLLETHDPTVWTQAEIDKARGCLAGWWRQIATPYAELSEREKDSDREWAEKALAIVQDGVTIEIESRSFLDIVIDGFTASRLRVS
jgi:hypothetical protein